MLTVVLPLLLLLAPIVAQTTLLLNATVGGSVLIPCSLPGYRLSLRWFYWQEGEQALFQWDSGKIIPIRNEHENRIQVFNSGFGSGNISIRLDNISPEDDQKTFFAVVKIKSKPPQQQCRSTLQVSAPYQDLDLTVNNRANSATCTARGGYPEAQVSWKGLNGSNNQQLDLQGAQTSLQQDPTEKTFSFTSSVNVTGLKSVTCVAYNPHSHESINRTVEIDAAADTLNQTPGVSTPSQNKDEMSLAAIIVPVVLILVLAGVLAVVFVWYRRQPNHVSVSPTRGDYDVTKTRTADPDPDPAPAPAQAEAGNGSEGAVSLTETGAEYRCLNTNTNDIAAAAPEEKEKLLKKENGNEENSKRHS